jgi:hypothetical protein
LKWRVGLEIDEHNGLFSQIKRASEEALFCN